MRWRAIVTLLMTVFLGGLVYLGQFFGEDSSSLPVGLESPLDVAVSPNEIVSLTTPTTTTPSLPHPTISSSLFSSAANHSVSSPAHKFLPLTFDPATDVLVFLHIQKTGGTTFGRHLVQLRGPWTPCNCFSNHTRCDCRHGNGLTWLFSRHSTGWMCGLHADWTGLNECVAKALDTIEHRKRSRRYLYVTMLRDPLSRYLSEWKHIQRGRMWTSAKLRCNGREESATRLQATCFADNSTWWTTVSLDEFLSCPPNLANNRQTRMLANLSALGCYDDGVASTSDYQEAILASAKLNLRAMAFFGLVEFQSETQRLFEDTFKVKFPEDFRQSRVTHASRVDVTRNQLERLTQVNSMDLALYEFAKQLFFQRLMRVSNRERGRVNRNATGFTGSFSNA